MSKRTKTVAGTGKTATILFVVGVLFLSAHLLSNTATISGLRDKSFDRNLHQTDKTTKITRTTTTTKDYTIRLALPAGQTKVGTKARDYTQSRVREFRSIASQPSTTPDTTRQTFENSVDVYETKQFISYVVRINQFTGGVNANQFVQTFVADTKRDHIASITDVIKADKRKQFIQSVQEKLKNTLQTKGNLGSGFQESINNIKIDDITTFYITKEGITVVFPPYTVAPGAAGTVSVTVSWPTKN